MELTDSEESSGISISDCLPDGALHIKNRVNKKRHESVRSSTVNNVRRTRSSTRTIRRLEDSIKEINEKLNRFLSSAEVHPISKGVSSIATHSVPMILNTPKQNSSANPYVTHPQHRIDLDPRYETAEQSMERKWKKYFGGLRAPLPFGTTLSRSTGFSIFGPSSFQDKISQFHAWQTQTCVAVTTPSTEEMLRQHRQWLQNYQHDISLIRTSADKTDHRYAPTNLETTEPSPPKLDAFSSPVGSGRLSASELGPNPTKGPPSAALHNQPV